jgi:hypothetical protein
MPQIVGVPMFAFAFVCLLWFLAKTVGKRLMALRAPVRPEA